MVAFLHSALSPPELLLDHGPDGELFDFVVLDVKFAKRQPVVETVDETFEAIGRDVIV